MQTHVTFPSPGTFTSAPLRNLIRVELYAPASEVWTLLGDLSRLPEYSGGLERVTVKKNASGVPEEYTCYFKPTEEGGAGAVARDLLRWYEPNRGWASVDAGPNDFGLEHSLHLVTLSPAERGTQVSWEAYYDTTDLDSNRTELDHALADIADRLIARFGGRVLDRYVEGLR